MQLRGHSFTKFQIASFCSIYSPLILSCVPGPWKFILGFFPFGLFTPQPNATESRPPSSNIPRKNANELNSIGSTARMPPRYRTSILVVFVLTFLYYTFPFSSREDDARVLNAGTASGEAAKPDAGHGALLHDDGEPPLVKTVERPNSIQTSSAAPLEFITSTSVMIPEATEAASKVQEEAVSQAQFNTENDALGV